MNYSLSILCISFFVFGITGNSSQFEAASIKPSGKSEQREYHQDAGRIEYKRVPLRDLIRGAYHYEYGDRVSGPSWLYDAEFDLVATFPAGTSTRGVMEMLANLLVDRFELSFHTLTKETPSYELILAPTGPKGVLKSTVGGEAASLPTPTPPPLWLFQGRTVAPGVERITFTKASMATLANALSSRFSRYTIPVFDRTGITGTFDFDIELSAEAPPPPSGPGNQYPLGHDAYDTIGALSPELEKQLGLRLRRSKVKLMYMVVDHALRVPIDN